MAAWTSAQAAVALGTALRTRTSILAFRTSRSSPTAPADWSSVAFGFHCFVRETSRPSDAFAVVLFCHADFRRAHCRLGALALGESPNKGSLRLGDEYLSPGIGQRLGRPCFASASKRPGDDRWFFAATKCSTPRSDRLCRGCTWERRATRRPGHLTAITLASSSPTRCGRCVTSQPISEKWGCFSVSTLAAFGNSVGPCSSRVRSLLFTCEPPTLLSVPTPPCGARWPT